MPTKIVGITGGIGAGKTTVCQIFEQFGVPIYYADDRAKQLMNSDADVRSKIIADFGNESYHHDQLNRAYLANKVFHDPEAVNRINAIVHPAVALDFEKWVTLQDAVYVLKEAALLIESGSYKNLDFLITIFSPEELRISRIEQRDTHRSHEEILGIIDKQVTEKQRQELADAVISNDETQLLIPQVIELHNMFMN